MAKPVRVMTRPEGIKTEADLDAFLDALGVEPEDPKKAKRPKKDAVKRPGKTQKDT